MRKKKEHHWSQESKDVNSNYNLKSEEIPACLVFLWRFTAGSQWIQQVEQFYHSQFRSVWCLICDRKWCVQREESEAGYKWQLRKKERIQHQRDWHRQTWTDVSAFITFVYKDDKLHMKHINVHQTLAEINNVYMTVKNIVVWYLNISHVCKFMVWSDCSRSHL